MLCTTHLTLTSADAGWRERGQFTSFNVSCLHISPLPCCASVVLTTWFPFTSLFSFLPRSVVIYCSLFSCPFIPFYISWLFCSCIFSAPHDHSKPFLHIHETEPSLPNNTPPVSRWLLGFSKGKHTKRQNTTTSNDEGRIPAQSIVQVERKDIKLKQWTLHHLLLFGTV